MDKTWEFIVEGELGVLMKKSLLTYCNGHKISISIWSTSYLEDFKADQATSLALAHYQSEFVIRSDEALIELWDSFLKSSETFGPF